MKGESCLDVSRLENVKQLPDGSIRARCPACAAAGSDKSGDHLLIQPNGKFGCAANPNDHEHRKQIFRLAVSPSLKLNGHSTKQIVATYDYTDTNGKLIFQVCRTSPKGFFQRRPDGKGGWINDTKSIEKVLFRLPEVKRNQGGLMFICEGEKDADAMVKHKLPATCNVGGAGKWLPGYSETLRGTSCVIIADKDKAGRDHAQLVASNLHGIARDVKIIELPDVNEKPVKDAYDFFAAGGDSGMIYGIMDNAAPWEPDGTGTIEAEKENPWFVLIQDAADIIAEELPPVVQIVNDILPEECKLIIAGGAKSFKTWVALYAALAISHGVPFLDRETAQRIVIYFNLELRPAAFKRRVQIVTKALGIDVKREFFIHVPLRGKLAGVPTFEIISRIIAIAKKYKAGVVVLDPVYKLLGNMEENSSGAMTALFNEIDRITTEAACTVILCDHFSKGNKSETDPLDAIRGSSAKAGDVDAAMIIRPHATENCFSVDLIHRELPPVSPFVLEWEFPLMKLRDDLDPENMKKAGRPKGHDPRKLLAAIIDNDEQNPISISQWAELTGIKRTTLNDYATEMRRHGYVKTVGDGNKAKQAITNKGKAFANGADK